VLINSFLETKNCNKIFKAKNYIPIFPQIKIVNKSTFVFIYNWLNCIYLQIKEKIITNIIGKLNWELIKFFIQVKFLY